MIIVLGGNDRSIVSVSRVTNQFAHRGALPRKCMWGRNQALLDIFSGNFQCCGVRRDVGSGGNGEAWINDARDLTSLLGRVLRKDQSDGVALSLFAVPLGVVSAFWHALGTRLVTTSRQSLDSRGVLCCGPITPRVTRSLRHIQWLQRRT